MARSWSLVLPFGLLGFLLAYVAQAAVVEHTFNVGNLSISQLCQPAMIITAVNGQLPGPTIEAREGDTVVVHLVNESPYDMTIHWHGIFQRGTPWADGPAMVTQCPVKPGGNYTPLQRDGPGRHAVVARPHLLAPRHRRRAGHPPPRRRRGLPVPQAPRGGDRPPRRVVERQRRRPGSDGVSHRQPAAERRRLHHQRQAGGLLQLLQRKPDVQVSGAAQRDVPAPDHQRCAQHAHVLQGGEPQLHRRRCRRRLHHAVRDRRRGDRARANRRRAHGRGRRRRPLLHGGFPVRQRHPAGAAVQHDHRHGRPRVRWLGRGGDAAAAVAAGVQRHRHGLPVLLQPDGAGAPRQADGAAIRGHPHVCQPAQLLCNTSGTRLPIFSSSMNNASFVLPNSVSMLQAHYANASAGIYTRDFPDQPPVIFDYTADASDTAMLKYTTKSTKVKTLRYNETVEMVLQNTRLIAKESHPMHLHGFNFFVLAQGFGNYDQAMATRQFNLVSPQERNTVAVPTGG
ncbi:laccase-25-like [Panicum miliaceum]|uniref:Laccase-25-like n=1 Tax=Panicum miliaceum TaxID=4540 RepID=A0A3L6T0Y4_PANMI|nr:laccase-25-like [Panicum miliaceum]